MALLYGQLSGAASLREIVTGLESHAARLYHLGADPVRRSTLSDANAQRPVAVFAALLAGLMQQAHRGLRRKLAETTYLIDSTGLRAERAQRRLGAFLGTRRLRRQAARHLRSRRRSPDLCRGQRGEGQRHHSSPNRCRSSPAPPTSSISAITIMPGGPSSTAAQCRIVTRFKANTPLAVVEELAGAGGRQHSFRPHRLSPRAPSQEPPQSDAGRGA